MPTTTVLADVVGLSDFAWARLRHRLIGLTDAEWDWRPTTDPDLGLRWRLDHLATTLRAERIARWLGRAPGTFEPKPPDTAGEAVAQLEASYANWRGHLTALDDTALYAAVGPVAGEYAESSRLAFALHIVDELIHHGAEAALLRDLWSARPDR